MSLSPTLFSGSGPLGIPPVPWNEKTIEREVGRAKDFSAPRYEPKYAEDMVNVK
jgi:hypothetical protein